MNSERSTYDYELALKKVLNPDNPFYRPLCDYGVTEEECWNYVKKMKEGVSAHFNYQKRMLKRIQNISIGLYTSGLFITVALFLICAIMGSGMLLIAIIGSVAALITAPIASIGMKKVADKRAKRLKDFMPPVDERIERLMDDYEKKEAELAAILNRTPEEEQAWFFGIQKKHLLEETMAEDIQPTGTFDPLHIKHVVERIEEMSEGKPVYYDTLNHLRQKADMEYEQSAEDLAVAITNHYLHSHTYPTPDGLASQTGISPHYCYAMLKEYRRQMGERVERMANEKENVTAHEVLYEQEVRREHIKTDKIIGYERHSPCHSLREEEEWIASGHGYELVPIYEYKVKSEHVEDVFRMKKMPPFVPADFLQNVRHQWSWVSTEAILHFGLTRLKVSIIYPGSFDREEAEKKCIL